MVYPHNMEDMKAERLRNSRKTARKKPARRNKKNKVTVSFPDDLARYFELKYPAKWRSFKEFATTYEKFSVGVTRLVEILLEGDAQDRTIFGLIPIDFLDQFGVVLELENCKVEKSLLLGNPVTGKSWSKVKDEIRFDGVPALNNLNPIPDPSKIDDPVARKSTEALVEHIKNHPVVLSALEMFGGEIVGYKSKEDVDRDVGGDIDN